MNARSMNGGDINARSMSGLNSSGGDGDALLAGGTTANPQIFTGVNEFDGTTNGNVGLIEQTASYNNSFIQTSGEQTNFIRQNGTATGFIIQEGDDSGIRQDGENAEIKQTGDYADIRQQGDGCGIRQSGENAIINQTGLNSVISSPRIRCNNLPVIGNDLCNKTYVDSACALLAGGDLTTPQEFTGVNDFNGGSLQMTNETSQNFQMIQTDTTTSVNNSFIMTGVNNRIQQTSLANGVINEFKQSGGATTSSSISQYTPTSTIYQDSTTATIVTKGRIGIGATNPSCELDVEGTTKLQNNGGYVYVYSGNIQISGSATSYTSWGNGGHHIDTFTTSNGTGRRMYINYYANQGVTLTRTNITSDDRIKEDEKFIENATDTLLKLRPQTYIKYAPVIDGSTIKPNFDLSGNFESGLIAQEIYYDAPELRHIVSITDMSNDDIIPSSDDPQKDPDYSDWGDMTAGVDYIQIIPYLIKSIQELNARVKELEAKFNNI